MSVALGKLIKDLEELKKEVKVPNIEEAKQEALKEIENYPDYDKKISAIIIEKTMGKLNDDFSQIRNFFASSTNKPVEIIDKLIAETDHGRELLQHQYTPVAPIETARTEEVAKEPSKEEILTETDEKPYKINNKVLNIIEGFGSKERISPKRVIELLPEETKKHYEGREKYLEKKVSASIIDATKKGIVEKKGYGNYRKIAESQDEYIETIKKIERDKEITTKDIYELLPLEIKEKYPVYENNKTIYMLFNLTKRARELNLIEETGKRDKNKKIFRRV